MGLPLDPVKEDSVVDLRHLSFSDWLASVDPFLAVQQYLPCIQESYDTVAQRLGAVSRWLAAKDRLDVYRG